MSEYIEQAKVDEVTHLVLDGGDNNPKFFNDVFYGNEEYPFLIKEFNSQDYGYNYIVKIYRIDFKEFDGIKIEN
jgi:hypothetical protein